MKEYNIVFLTNQPLNTSFVGMPLQLNKIFGYSLQVGWTGNANGTFKLQASCDANFTGVLPTLWTDIQDSSKTIPTDGSGIWNYSDCWYTWVRLVYTDNSGGTSTAVLNTATFNAKGGS